MSAGVLSAFGGFGIELEYAIVERESLNVLPIADQLLAAAAGQATSALERGPLAWSNELSLHVIELKTNGPAPSLDGLADLFSAELDSIDALLAPFGARILPCAMHPWMDPTTERALWPHEQNEIYRAYDRIFGCGGHGWVNLQSMHINLPFASDAEFVRLHTAIRTVLPLLPGLAAASPYADGRATGLLDTRLDVYRRNQARVPEITGAVVPEAITSIDAYHGRILEPLNRAIAPLDPEGVLHGEWLNSRGAIARFERDAIEIRVLDTQESPQADLAVAALVIAAVRERYEAGDKALKAQLALPTEALAQIFNDCVRDGEAALVADMDYLTTLGLPRVPLTAGQIWTALSARNGQEERRAPGRQTLARRLLQRGGMAPDRETLRSIYRELIAARVSGGVFV